MNTPTQNFIIGIRHRFLPLGELIADAKNAAIAAGITILASIPQIPIYIVPENLTPTIYRDTISYLKLRPDYFVLDYMANRTKAAKNRREALRGLGPAGALQSWDEFPYASTSQGGAGSFVQNVFFLENAVQGGLLGSFYKLGMKARPGPFLVVPIPRVLRIIP